MKFVGARWVVACMVGAGASASLADSAIRTASEFAGMSFGLVALMVALGAAGFGGVAAGVAVAQVALLRPKSQWLEGVDGCIGKLVAGAASGAAGLGVLAALGEDASSAGAIAIVVGIAVFPVVEWLVLRGRVQRAYSIVAFSLAGLVSGNLATIVAESLRDGFATSWTGWALFGAIYAAVTCVPLRDAG